MGNAELERMSVLFSTASSPETIFGTLVGEKTEQLHTAKKIYLRVAKTVHPDLFHDRADIEKAALTFKMLTHFWEQAQSRIERGTYGVAESSAFKPFVLRTSTHRYRVERFLGSGDIGSLYVATTQVHGKGTSVVLKISRKPEDNDLANNEVRVLKHLQNAPDYRKLRHFVSYLLEDFLYEEHSTGVVRQAAMLSYLEGFYPLKEIKNAYLCGIDVKDMAWMWRRILVALDFAHTNQVIHGAVLPTHILVHPEQHGVVLIDWSYAVLHARKTHEYIRAISSQYRAWYPAEVFTKEEPTPGIDIAMAATCMIDLLGGNAQTHSMPATVPWQIQQHLQGCVLPLAQQRPQQAHELLQAFDELIERLWGSKTFHQFIMPKR